MSAEKDGICCPRFDPAPWQEQVITWKDKLFARDRVRAILHVPLNFGLVVRRNMKLLEEAGAVDERAIMLTDERSPWTSDLYIELLKEAPGVTVARLSGTFMTRVFEGPYRNVRAWCAEMHQIVAAQGKSVRRLLFYYTTCPRCAKRYGKNYVVLLAEIG